MTNKKIPISRATCTTIGIVVLIAVVALIAVAMDGGFPSGDTGWSDWPELFGLSKQDLPSLRKTLAENKNQLHSQRETQMSFAREADQNETDLFLKKEALCRLLLEAKERGTLDIPFGDRRRLSIADGREWLAGVVKALRLLADEKQFRANVVRKIDERIDEVTSDLRRIDQAISVQDVADLFDKIDKNKGRYEPLIDKSRLRDFDSIRNRGPLTEDELIALVNSPQTAARYDVNIDNVLDEHRQSQHSQRDRQGMTPSSNTVVSKSQPTDKSGESWELILVRPPQNAK